MHFSNWTNSAKVFSISYLLIPMLTKSIFERKIPLFPPPGVDSDSSKRSCLWPFEVSERPPVGWSSDKLSAELWSFVYLFVFCSTLKQSPTSWLSSNNLSAKFLLSMLISFYPLLIISSLEAADCPWLVQVPANCSHNFYFRPACPLPLFLNALRITYGWRRKREYFSSNKEKSENLVCLSWSRGGRSFLKIHFFIETGLKMIQFKIQFKTKSQIFILKNHLTESKMFNRITHSKNWGKLFKIPK